MRDIFDIMRKDIKNKHININAELLYSKPEVNALNELADTLMKMHYDTPDKIEATVNLDNLGYFVKTFEIRAKMTEDVYDSVYSLHGAIIEEFNNKPIDKDIDLTNILGENVRWSSIVSGAIRVDRDVFESSALDGEPIQWPNPVERTCFRDGVLGQWQEDADGDSFMGFGSWRPVNSSTWERIRNSEEHEITVLDEFGITVEDSDTLPIFNLDDFIIRHSDNERRIH